MVWEKIEIPIQRKKEEDLPGGSMKQKGKQILELLLMFGRKNEEGDKEG